MLPFGAEEALLRLEMKYPAMKASKDPSDEQKDLCHSSVAAAGLS